MKKIKTFFINVFVGGLLIVLPIAILYKVIQWLLSWLTELIAPLTGLIIATTHTNEKASEVIGLLFIITSCFFIGLVVRTASGRWIHGQIERWLLEWIPGYSTLKELFDQFSPEKKRAFSKPVLVSLDDNKNFFMGYITDEYGEDQYAVFIPTSPSPMNGFVIQTTKQHIQFLDVSPEKLMKLVVGCGVGSSSIMTSEKP